MVVTGNELRLILDQVLADIELLLLRALSDDDFEDNRRLCKGLPGIRSALDTEGRGVEVYGETFIAKWQAQSLLFCHFLPLPFRLNYTMTRMIDCRYSQRLKLRFLWFCEFFGKAGGAKRMKD